MPLTGYCWLLQRVTSLSTNMVTTNVYFDWLQLATGIWYAQIGFGIWKPLFGATYLARVLTNWLLLLTTTGYFTYYTYTTSTTLSSAHIGSGKWKPLFGETYWTTGYYSLLQLVTNSSTQLVTTDGLIQLVTALWSAHIGSGNWKPLFGATYLARAYF